MNPTTHYAYPPWTQRDGRRLSWSPLTDSRARRLPLPVAGCPELPTSRYLDEVRRTAAEDSHLKTLTRFTLRATAVPESPNGLEPF